ncbi:class F sortase [Nesterenkonia sp. Act20]|uniref:class F sortase n=1 Tax=Nesterenkonia sp. Act20 TaxID=1483432 RepID=UPI00350E4DEB
MKQTRGRRLVAISALGVLLLSGCAGDAEGDPAAESTEAAAETPSAPSSEPSADESSDAEPTEEATEEATEATPSPESEGDTEPAAMEASEPVSFSAPAIDAGSDLLHLGLRENDTLEVPPGAPGSPASWYTGSPTPGEVGPAVLLGHVDDSAGQPGVFAALPQLAEGDEITVEREDGSTAVFSVTKAEQYGKNDFPTLEVYGNTDAAELRLITCDGYNQETGEYEDNYVVYATLAE